MLKWLSLLSKQINNLIEKQLCEKSPGINLSILEHQLRGLYKTINTLASGRLQTLCQFMLAKEAAIDYSKNSKR